MTVIDSLVVKLGLDSKDFQRGSKAAETSFTKTKQAAQKTGKDIEYAGKQGAEFFNQLRKSAIQFFSVLTVGRGIADFTRQVIGSGAQLDRMATRVGESASQLSRWQGAVRQSGGSAEGFLATIQGISNQFTQLKETGDAPIRMLLQQLGVSAADATGKAKPVLELIRDIGDSLEGKQWSNADKFNKLLAAGFDEGTINLLLRGRQEREKLLAAQREYNDADAKAARIAEEKWELAKQRMEKLTQTLVFKLLPIFEKGIELLESFGEIAVAVFDKSIEGWGKIFDWTSLWVEKLHEALELLGKITGFDIRGTIGKGTAKVLAFFGNKEAQAALDANEKGVVPSTAPTSKAEPPMSYNMANELAAAEKANGLPAGLLSSIVKQETGGRQAFIDDPSKYHYEKDASGKRKSSAFGPFGILESTARDPGYGVSPLKDKSLQEQTRFAAQYAAARIRAAGSVAGGLAGYGEGDKYAAQVIGRLPMTGVSTAGAGRGNTNPSSVSIGEVNVYTQATDANGIARDLQASIVRQSDTAMR